MYDIYYIYYTNTYKYITINYINIYYMINMYYMNVQI